MRCARTCPPGSSRGSSRTTPIYARGEAAVVDPAVERVTGHPARDLVDFACEHAAAFAPAFTPVPGRVEQGIVTIL
jgi:hypothetical protein